jgi:hypothetical protein
VRKIKTLTDPCPHFARQAAKYDHLVELQSNTQRLKRGERYIKYSRTFWCVYTHSDKPQICGRYNNVMSAVFYALK